MNQPAATLPLLPLLLADVSTGLRCALAQEGVPHATFDPVDPAGRFVLYDARRAGRPSLQPGQTAIDVAGLSLGNVSDPFTAFIDERSARRAWRLNWQPRRFNSQTGRASDRPATDFLLVAEETARHDKRLLRRELLRGLQHKIEAHGGLWLRLATVPFPYRTVFNFRLDHDDYIVEDFDATLEALAGHEEAITHFVCGSTHAERSFALAQLRGMDVGSHGYWHHTYRDADENYANIARGIDALRLAGIEPSGFAAPHGRYSRGLAAALARAGVRHSSEFAFSYDDWPAWPGGSSVLQLPIHPVCLGSALEAARERPDLALSANDVASLVARHFRQVVLARHKAHEPILLYGHPNGRLGRYPAVLRQTLSFAATLPGVWRTSLTNFAAWWRARSEIICCVWPGGSAVRIDAAGLPGQHRAAVEVWRGDRVAIVPLSQATTWFSPDQLTYEARSSDDTPRGERSPQSVSLRQRLLRRIDWEHVTPTDEIGARSLRGWLKRSLRQVRDHVQN